MADLDLVPPDPATVELHRWRRVDGGYVKLHESRTFGEVYEDLARRILALSDDETAPEWISFQYRFSHPRDGTEPEARLMPRYGYDPGSLIGFACYATTGGSEGNLAHVDLITRHPDPAKARRGINEVTPFLLVKTFCGMEHAAAIARACTEWLDQ